MTKTHTHWWLLTIDSVRIIFSYTHGMSYANVLFVANLNSLKDRRDKLPRSFFQNICKPASCLHHLLPPLPTSLQHFYNFQATFLFSSPSPNLTNQKVWIIHEFCPHNTSDLYKSSFCIMHCALFVIIVCVCSVSYCIVKLLFSCLATLLQVWNKTQFSSVSSFVESVSAVCNS